MIYCKYITQHSNNAIKNDEIWRYCKAIGHKIKNKKSKNTGKMRSLDFFSHCDFL